jgi:hypothetical protein
VFDESEFGEDTFSDNIGDLDFTDDKDMAYPPGRYHGCYRDDGWQDEDYDTANPEHAAMLRRKGYILDRPLEGREAAAVALAKRCFPNLTDDRIGMANWTAIARQRALVREKMKRAWAKGGRYVIPHPCWHTDVRSDCDMSAGPACEFL